MKSRLTQIIVYVSNMPRSISFYRDLLGLTLVSESAQWSRLAADGFDLALHTTSQSDEVSGQVPVPAGRAELIFEVDNLDQACQDIQAMGGAFEGPKEMEGLNIRVAFLRDPDGMAIELVERERK